METFMRYWPIVRGIRQSLMVPLTKSSEAELWCFLWDIPEQTVQQTIDKLAILDAIALIMTSL